MPHADLHVTFCIDDGYIDGAVVTGMSIRSSLADPGTGLTFHVMDGGLSPQGRNRLQAALGCVGNVELRSMPDLLALSYRRKWITTPALGRLWIDQAVPEDVGRTVYLDADTLVLEDLTRLHDVDLGGNVLGAVSNRAGPDRTIVLTDVAVQHEHGATPPGYFNSGVLVIDLVRWRQDRITEQALRLFHRYREHLRSIDQDILNIIFEGRWTRLPSRWNKQIGRFGDDDRIAEIIRREGIVHYTGEVKPWHADFPRNPLLDLYSEYLPG